MLTVGDKLPELVLPVQQGTEALPAGETINLAETNGKWKILFYWPKDFTFVCPTEIVGYGELAREFADRDAVLIGASTDTAHVHFAWRRSDPELAGADFPWIADNGAQLASALISSNRVLCTWGDEDDRKHSMRTSVLIQLLSTERSASAIGTSTFPPAVRPGAD